MITRQDILQKISEDNQKLSLEVEDFKASEIAKKVTTLYEKYYDEIQAAIEKVKPQKQKKDIGSLYIYLLSRDSLHDLAKRYLLD